MNDLHPTFLITVAIVLTIVASCTKAPTQAPASSAEPQVSTNSELVILPTKTKGIIRGFVLDAEMNHPIPYANVMIVGTQLGAMSVKSGEFAISGVTPGMYKVRAMMMYYTEQWVDSVIVSAGKETHVSFHLKERVPTYEEHR